MDRKIKSVFELKIFSLPLFSVCRYKSWYKKHRKLQSASAQPEKNEKTSERKNTGSLFVINSLMLDKCFKLLTQTPAENLHVVTGSMIGSLRSLEQIIPLRLSVQSVTGASAEDQSLVEELLKLYEFGLRPLGYFHSHPGSGISATLPSNTDRNTQTCMERSGSDIIGAIFSRDGFVRFYANSRVPNVKVLGKRVRRIEKNVYKLEIEKDL